MAKYEVWIVTRPEGFCGASLDDAPPQPGQPREVLARVDDLFVAVRAAIDFNEKARRAPSAEWAVVVQPACPGRKWPNARLCTPLSYRVGSIEWPTGWEPQSPWDVPGCPAQIQGGTDPAALTYEQALAAVRGLNQQSIDQAGSRWYVLAAIENEPISQAVTYDPSGVETTTQVRPLHVVRPEQGGRGDCSYCPAHSLPCAAGDWTDSEQTAAVTTTRSLYAEP